jgi:hypothetical protein
MKNKTLVFTLIFAFLFAFATVKAEETKKDEMVNHLMWYPHAYKKWHVSTALGFSMVKPPLVWVFASLTAPIINFHMNLGLPKNFAITGDVSTIVVSNQIRLGPNWSYRLGNTSFNIGYDAALIIGQMKVKEYNNRATAILLYPNISVGYKIKRVAFTLKGEVNSLVYSKVTAGEDEMTHRQHFFNGGSAALYIEQKLWKNHYFTVGLKDNINKLYWPVWLLFTTYNRYYQIPELYFSFGL